MRIGIVITATVLVAQLAQAELELAGVTVTPHVMAEGMHFRNEPEPAEGARVQLFLRNASSNAIGVDADSPLLFDGQTPSTLLENRRWAWHDMPAVSGPVSLPPDAMTVWTFNGRKLPFGPEGTVPLAFGPDDASWLTTELAIEAPDCWLSAVTFLGPEESLHPNAIVVHIANERGDAVTFESCRLWIPPDPKQPRVLLPTETLTGLQPFNGHETIPAGDRGGFVVHTEPLPLTYCVFEVTLSAEDGQRLTLWTYLRIKAERFDISGSWVNDRRNTIANETFLKTLKRLHVNTAYIAEARGYTDTDLYDRYPLKYMHTLKPFERYDTDEMLPRIHAAECLGEPQYGGGTPVPPQNCVEDLLPYTKTRIPTSITHSDPSTWRDYMGLADYPHYDAYRVSAPSADLWWKYDRWDKPIGWGAPLETSGAMSRSLREMSRPAPCAIWTQGPHDNWGVYGGRQRTSPTPVELRMQAYHAIATRVTSLYWFNLSANALVQFPDTIEELARIGRELRLIDEFQLEGDAYAYERLTKRGKPDWDLASVCGPRAALLFALDLDYEADDEEKVFKFGEPRRARFKFELPEYIGAIEDVFRLDANGVHEVKWKERKGLVSIRTKTSRAVMYVATPDTALREHIESKRQRIIAEEEAIGFDPGQNKKDFAALKALVTPAQPPAAK
jgi:hypothetical protein